MNVCWFILVFVLSQGLWALMSYRRFCRELKRHGEAGDEVQLRGKVRSQVQLGNEGAEKI